MPQNLTYDPELAEILGLGSTPRLTIPEFFKPHRDLIEDRAKNRTLSKKKKDGLSPG